MLLAKILDAMTEQNALLRRFLIAEKGVTAGRKRSSGMAMQLAKAFKVLLQDPSHNIALAARKTFNPEDGYASEASLKWALYQKWHDYMRANS